MKRTVISVVGARPQFIKLAPLCRAFSADAPDWQHIVVHTGQHYDYAMSEVFFRELGIPKPDFDLDVGSGSHAMQTARMLTALEAVFTDKKPDAVLVYGDTNSTLAATLAASKLHLHLAHIEAGLRSFDRTMPEEINRIIADHCSDTLFVPTVDGMRNLERENLAARAVLVGDVMYDAVLYNLKVADAKADVVDQLSIRDRPYAIITIHRPSNTSPQALTDLLSTFAELADRDVPLIWPMHPRTRGIFYALGTEVSKNLRIVEPVSYLEMLYLLSRASVVLTDSGGLQKEAAFVGTPCITLRNETEWTETVEMGANQVAGTRTDRIHAAFDAAIAQPDAGWTGKLPDYYGHGDAANRIVIHLIEHAGQWFRSKDKES